MKIQDLTDTQLDGWVAKAQGWVIVKLTGRSPLGDDYWVPREEVGQIAPRHRGEVYMYSPTSNDAQAMALVKEFDVWLSSEDGVRIASCSPHAGEAIQEHENLNRAICLAVVASKFGDEVEGSYEYQQTNKRPTKHPRGFGAWLGNA